MKIFRKYFFRTLKVLLILFVVLCIAVFTYVSLNKKSIIEQVKLEIETSLNGKLSLGKVELSFFRNFPSVSVLLHDVKLTDTFFDQHKHTFFTGKEVFISLSVPKLIKKQSPLKGVRIDDAELYLFTDTTGYTNTYLMKSKEKKSGNKGSTELKKIELNRVRIVLDDRIKMKLHDLAVKQLKIDVDDENGLLLLDTKADIQINSLAFNVSKGSYLKDKAFRGNFRMHVNKATKELRFDDIRVKISGQPFTITGKFDGTGESPQFDLKVNSRGIKYALIKELVPQKISRSLSIVDLDKPIDVSATVSGPLKGGDPLVNVNWAARNTTMLTPFMDFDKATFKGNFTNEVITGLPRKDPNSRIRITEFSAAWHDMPVTSRGIEILDLSVPALTCDLASEFELKKLNDLIGENSLQLREGTGVVRLNYKGPIVKNNNTNSFLNGDITFRNGNILYVSRDVEMKQVNGRIIFRNSDVIVEKLQAIVLGQNIQMDGQAKSLLTLINTEPDKANIDWSIYSPSLNMEAFTFLLSPRKKAVAKQSDKGIAAASAKIDNLLEHGKLHVVLNTARLKYKNFNAENVIADVTLLQDRYIINKVSMQHAGGRMDMSGSLISNGSGHAANLLVNMNSVDVSRVFKAFDNFGQDGITAQNLEGKLSTKIDAALQLDPTGKVLPSSIVSTVDFSLKDGALNNFEPVKKLQKFVFKNRDFDNIRFAELKNRFEVRDRSIKINRMEIQSTVMSMFVEGIYSMTGSTDMSIQVPLSNLKKRDADYNPENIGNDKKAGGSIFIRGRPGADGNVKFKLDLFNKFDKQKGKK